MEKRLVTWIEECSVSAAPAQGIANPLSGAGVAIYNIHTPLGDPIARLMQAPASFGWKVKIISGTHNGAVTWGVYVQARGHDLHGEGATPAEALAAIGTQVSDLYAQEWKA